MFGDPDTRFRELTGMLLDAIARPRPRPDPAAPDPAGRELSPQPPSSPTVWNSTR
ncbi:MAG TPA: hypothetical protein VMH35_13000 [Streptosporangiaceae bacterium]|nr:hypothetical protein [Streptosporangiaceae bacterium]